MKANRLKRKLNKKVLKKYGIELTFLRFPEDAQTDRYGEPTDSPWPFEPYQLQVMIEHERDILDQMQLGGLTDDKKEYLHFWCSGDADIRMADKVIYPPDSSEQWLVNRIEPYVMDGVTYINEVRAMKDDRYGS